LLFIEDHEDDALLTVLELRRAGYDVLWERVADAASMSNAIPVWDLILCDYALPGFDPALATKLARQMAPNVPLIMYSGVVGEYRASQMIAAGARDFLVKGDSARLVDAVQRTFEEAESRRLEEHMQEVE
jgi:sigma-B regulation protein RsbU (phosphoserine phosphatase)